MADSVGLIIWLIGIAFELAFVVCSLARRSFGKYLFLNLYLLMCLASGLSRAMMLRHFGQDSPQYFYWYFYTDVLLTLALYIAVTSLFVIVLSELKVKEFVFLAAGVLLLGTVAVSYLIVRNSDANLTSSFAVELSQNLYFVGLIMTYVLWGTVLKLRETRTRLIQFILSLGVYFSAYAANFALVSLAQHSFVAQYLSPALGCLLPLSWTMTVLRYSEESRLETAQLVAVPR